MVANREEPQIFVEGIEEVIKRDLEKHKGLLEQTQRELDAYKQSRSHEIRRKKYYKSLIGGGKFDDDALRASMDDIASNIRHLSDKVDLSREKLEHHTLIVDTLTQQLEDQNKALAALAKYRRDQNGAQH
jgi:hypothetical protein